ncbi:MAG: insulinase family protein [Pseudanabaenales cyanobacterium]|nr:insulinase family protein [Pseudanabaenales cyanobacterium]
MGFLNWFTPTVFQPSFNQDSNRTSRHKQSLLSSRIAALLLVAVMGWLGLPAEIATARGLDLAPEVSTSIQPYLDRVANQVTEFTLDNGMKFIVLERHQAPVVSCMLYAKVGAANEIDGHTGIAHYLEHLAFKGTPKIGVRDYPAEQQVLDELDQTFDQLLAAEADGQTEQANRLQQRLEELQAKAASYVKQNEYGQIIEQAGGVGLNATTGAEATRYFYSLPANKLELWMSLESERFIEPVFREFFREKDVILEERRLRVDNSPIGLMVEKFLETAFDVHPYRRPIIGYEADLYQATRQDIQEFYQTYYGPSNLLATVVGDVDPNQVKQFAESYFGRYQTRSAPPELKIEEPLQTAPREFTLELVSQPWYLEGYHRPALTHPDHVVYGMIESILVGGRTTRLYKSLVEDSQVALNVGSINGFPGDKHPNIFLLYGLTAPDHTVEEVAELFDQELARLKTEPVSPEELDRVKTQARAGLLRNLSSNQGMASLLAEYEAKTGNWRNVFDELIAIEAVTAEDVQRVAQATFQPNNRTIGKLISANS